MNRRELREHIAVFEASGIKVDSFVVDYHLKLALPGASLIFVLLAVPFGFHSGRGGRFFAVLVGLGIVFLYYAATSIFRSMGANGILATGPAAWLSNILFGGVGGSSHPLAGKAIATKGSKIAREELTGAAWKLM